ncbi:MerR family transcriptional regulator [Streptomyces blastmyceticus]|uniref:MerR family transcriptional regulator n=1 Tax=Streptomyces blastmyceticus TaxID=68180 RepID=UPI0031D58CAE
MEDLAHRSGATVRTIRAYQDRGLLPRSERRGRANVYGEAHLARLHQIAGLLDRGYTLASIKELLDAWDAGRGLGGVLGLVAEVDGPWTDERAERITRVALHERFGDAQDDEAVTEAVRLGVLVAVPDAPDEFLVPSPRELAVAAELHLAGVPLPAISGHLRELRTHVEHIAARFLDFTTEHVFHQFFDHPPTDEEAAEAAALVRRLRPLAQQTVDAELARAMRELATRYLRHRLGGDAGDEPPVDPAGDAAVVGPVDLPPPRPLPAASHTPDSASQPGHQPLQLPARTLEAVRELVGAEHVAAFVAAAAEREVQARTMDALLPRD